jgi:hypothetical protein
MSGFLFDTNVFLVARDVSRFRTYFPKVVLISP